MKRFGSIRAKSAAYTFLIMIVPIAILGACGTIYFQDVVKQKIQNDFMGEARAVSDLTINYFDRAVLYLEGRSDDSRLIRAVENNDTAALEDQVARINDATPLFYWVFVADTTGKVIASHPYGSFSGVVLNRSDYVVQATWTGKSSITSPEFFPQSNRSSVFVTAPILQNGTTIGVLVGAIDGYQYYDMLNRLRSSVPGQSIYVVNSTGHVIAHHDLAPVRSMADYSAVPPVQELRLCREGTMRYNDPIAGGEFLGAYSPIPKYGWGAVVAQPMSDAYRPVDTAIKALALATALLALLAVPLSIVVGNYLTRPIAKISMATQLIGENVDLARYLPYDRDDELGRLAIAFKDMSDRIATARRKIMGEKKRADMYIDVMGHDINNMNQIVLSNLEIVQEMNDKLDPRRKEFLAGAIAATRDSADIVRNVKAIQSLYSEKLETRPIDLDGLILDAVREAPKTEGKEARFHYRPQKARLVNAVPQLELALLNVIRNSIKYSGPVVDIDISVSETTADGKKAYAVAITDDGFGIPDSVKKTLFTRFQEDSDVPPGKGIGLYTTMVLVEHFGGSIEVENRVPEDDTKGTRVIITLPAAGGS